MISTRALRLVFGCLVIAWGCDRKPDPGPNNGSPAAPTSLANGANPNSPASSGTTLSIAALSPRISRPAPARLVAIGDLHGDLDATRRTLRLAGAIDEKDAWIGGALVVVQTGDELDRGDDDRAILDLTDRLRESAKQAGGELILLSGNHELMNVQLDFRYVTPGAFASFPDMKPGAPDPKIAMLAEAQRGRAASFMPGGVYAKVLANRPIVMRVGDSIFVHGGILPKHVDYGLDKMTDEVSGWMRGERAAPPPIVVAEDGPVWTRAYSENPGANECALLGRALASLSAKRMIVGHTVQSGGITSACDGRVWRIDVGLSRFFGGPTQELEIVGDAVSIKKQ